MVIETSALGTLPTVIFKRTDLPENSPASIHAIVFESVQAAKAAANRITAWEHLKLIAIIDAVVKSEKECESTFTG